MKRESPRKSQHSDHSPVTVGWKEYIDLSEWGIFGIRAKIDTGAKSSSLHVEDIAELPDERIRFFVIPDRRKPDHRIAVETDIKRMGRVRSSTGHYTQRYFVETTLRLGGIERRIEINLVDRKKMIHRMLIGRTALCDAFVVDVGLAYTTQKNAGQLTANEDGHRRETIRDGR